ncbi:MAG: polysaccharide biosynthesis tyrosine autokinase [Nocardioidaceae bacterium]
MELSDYLRILRAHWVGVVALALTATVAAAVFSLSQPKVYAANANGFVSSGLNADPALASVGDSLAKSRAKSYVDIAKSRATAQDVIGELNLDAEPASLIGHITVDHPVDTVLIKVTARSSTPKQAQKLADAWIAALAAQVDQIENPTGKAAANRLRIVPVESAELPKAPISPQVDRNVLLGAVLGLLLGLGYAVVRNQLDRRIRSAAAVEKQFSVTVVGAIPASPDLQHAAGAPAHIAVEDVAASRGSSEAAEAFRKLRTNLQFMDVDSPPRVIVVTSPQQGDGKSTVAANLAAAIAASGQAVVLMDGDLRRPSVADSLGLVEGAGLTDVLVGRVGVDDVLQSHPGYPSLSVLAAGGIPPNPSELLGSQAMRSLVNELAEKSIVVVDAPPLLPVTDAAVLTAVADGAFIVISTGKTLDTELGAALAHLEAVSGRALGVVFNRVPKRDAEARYYGGQYQPTVAEAEPLVAETQGAAR